MSRKIPGEQVVDYIRNTLQPISYDVLLSKFCSSKESEETREGVKDQLHTILLANVKSGSLMHYRNHFYCSSLSNDLQDMAGFNFHDDLPSDESNISISSCESFLKKKATRKNVQQQQKESVDEIKSSNDLDLSKSELSVEKSQMSNDLKSDIESQDDIKKSPLDKK